MSRTRRPPLFGGNTTFAGAVVTVTAALVTLGLFATTCVLYLRGDNDGAKDAALQASAALTATVALLSRTRQDPAATIEQPATVTASTGPGDQ